MTAFVLDASVTIAWCFEDEATPYSRRVLDLVVDGGVSVPAIWPLEVTNVILVAIRAKRMVISDAARFLAMIKSLPIEIEPISCAATFTDTFDLAVKQGLSSYDAAYLELACRRRLSLASLDKRLRRAATNVGVTLVS